VRTYIIRRLLLLIPTLLLVATLIFIIVKSVPSDIIDAMQPGVEDVELDRPSMERELGLDAPVIVQYGRWLGVVPQVDGSFSGVFQGDLGTSWWTKVTVVELLALKWPVTLELGLMGLIVAQLIALPIGIYSALWQDEWGENKE